MTRLTTPDSVHAYAFQLARAQSILRIEARYQRRYAAGDETLPMWIRERIERGDVVEWVQWARQWLAENRRGVA